MSADQMAATQGVEFPLTGEPGTQRRSTTTFGRTVVAAALDGVDPVGAAAAARETSWRSGYLAHFGRLVEAGLVGPDAAVRIARQGADAIAGGMRWVEDGREMALADAPQSTGAAHETVEVSGGSPPAARLELPYRGELLSGDRLTAQLDAWVSAGVVEPSVAASVADVAAHPEWLRLPGRTLVALGVGSEVGPASVFLRWGATVAGVDLPRPDIWQRVLADASEGAGTLLVPARRGDAPLAERAGIDLLAEMPSVAAWISALDGPLVLGNYLYADGGLNVRVSAASDEVASRVRERHADLVLAYLATPTDVFAVPGEAVAASVAAYEGRSRLSKVPGRGLRALSGGRLLRRAYLPGAEPGLCDALVPQQGPNYALGKRLHRWRAVVEAAEGRPVSMNIAPPTRTRSVVKNRALAAAYAGAHRFGIEVFEPATTRVLMAALLVHDLYVGPPDVGHPWWAEADQACHGGLWRAAYAPRSALGLAALLGYGASRG
ncbi:hypothetical protein [Nocardioides sp. YIM 152588]|uniref:hypothetical protein n=1 Tax=Nocardioides sp. YIM 152588 TaxID=3158259 RepID=UPI0032E4A837